VKKLLSLGLFSMALAINISAFAENRAVYIGVVSNGTALDTKALKTVRTIVGKAITTGVVDTFIVYSPKTGGPIPIEGGLGACAEAGFGTSQTTFRAFVNQLRAVRAEAGTTVNLISGPICKSI
jgi:hypothetical protein